MITRRRKGAKKKGPASFARIAATYAGEAAIPGPYSGTVQRRPAFPCTEKRIVAVCDLLSKHLIGKHRSYGATALYPIQIFGRGHAVEGLQVRIDDKLSRIKNNPSAYDEDAVLDLMGYLVLLRLAKEDEAARALEE